MEEGFLKEGEYVRISNLEQRTGRGRLGVKMLLVA